jgi:hypothetical protein
VLLDLAPLPSLTRWLAGLEHGRTIPLPDSPLAERHYRQLRGGQSFGRRCWRLRHEIAYPTVIALLIAVGFFFGSLWWIKMDAR